MSDPATAAVEASSAQVEMLAAKRKGIRIFDIISPFLDDFPPVI
jgi:hypothetical protein